MSVRQIMAADQMARAKQRARSAEDTAETQRQEMQVLIKALRRWLGPKSTPADKAHLLNVLQSMEAP
jgi:hypothetical protein